MCSRKSYKKTISNNKHKKYAMALPERFPAAMAYLFFAFYRFWFSEPSPPCSLV